jgi:hypothetical protein
MNSFVEHLRTYAYRSSTPYVEPAYNGSKPLNGPFSYSFWHGYTAIPFQEPIATTYQYMAPFAPIRKDLYMQLMQLNAQQAIAAQAPATNVYSGILPIGEVYQYG